MGQYVNPPHGTKETWLNANGIMAPMSRITWSDVPTGMLPVILVNNGAFTAAGVAYDKDELAAFQTPSDTRPRKVFFVTTAKLVEVIPGFGEFAQRHGIRL
ncbi:MAG: hypothetical protein NTU97_00145 [Candidatus Magasanikbacteria bacterium]|nr:hypothetical protein [Candidatus Magasanikbacteria bacterium]